MNEMPEEADGVARLRKLQLEVRELARTHGWFEQAIRAAFPAFLDLCGQHKRAEAALDEEVELLVGALLQRGLVYDPAGRTGARCLIETVRGPFPVELVRAVEPFCRGELPPELEGKLAEAALAVRAGRAPAGDVVDYPCDVVVTVPTAWGPPPDPWSVEPEDLQRHSEEDYLTIALHRLGGLADMGNTRPIVPRPVPTGEEHQDFVNEFHWRQRFLVVWPDINDPLPAINPARLPPDIADEMFSVIKAWWASRFEPPRRAKPTSRQGPVRPQSPPIRRPCEEALAAWRLRDLSGLKTQAQIAEVLAQQLGRPIAQGQVSRWLREVEGYLRAGNVLPPMPAPLQRPTAIDPAEIEKGPRSDRRSKHQRGGSAGEAG